MKRTIPWNIALVLAACAPAEAQETPEPFLVVTGSGEARVATDRARLDFMVETQAVTAQEATTENGDRMDRVITALRAVGGATVAVETGGYNLSPVYRQPARNQNEVPTIEAYRAVNHVRVRADDLDRVGGLIDASITAGANRIASLTFEAKDPEPARPRGAARCRSQGQIRGRDRGGSDGGRSRDATRGPDQRRSWGPASPADVPDDGNGPGSGPHAGRAG